MTFFGVFRSKLPAALKRPVRRMVDAADACWRRWRLARYVAAIRQSPAAFYDSRSMAAMHRAWGNEAWSADPGYLQALGRRMAHATGPILECGSGLTTIVVGVLAELRGVPVLSLEQDAWWANFVQSELSRLNIKQVKVMHTPLSAYDGFLWYDVTDVKLPDSFELAICDGPAIYGKPEPYQSAWRVGLLPVLRDRGVRVDEILLDDADDARLVPLLARWREQHHLLTEIARTETGTYLIARAGALANDS